MTSPTVSSPEITTSSTTANTPIRNNYAAAHTPIASAKRPRNPGSIARIPVGAGSCRAQQTRLSNQGGSDEKNNSVEVNSTPVRNHNLSTPPNSNSATSRSHRKSGVRAEEMSPMHPPKAVPSYVHGGDVPINNDLSSEFPLEADDAREESNQSNSNNNSLLGIFSPVLNFLQQKPGNDENPDELCPHDEDPITVVSQNDRCISKAPYENVHSSKRIDYDGDFAMTESHPTGPSEHVDQTNTGEVHNTREATSYSGANKDSYEQHTSVQHEEGNDINLDQHESIDDDASDDEEEFNPYLFMKTLPRYSTVVPNPHAKICLPLKDPCDPPITLVLDLDETLVHCTVEPIPDADMVFPVLFNGVQYKVHVRTRPYLTEFLMNVSKKFEVVVFTASQKVYADELLNRIDPDGKYIKHRMFREACLLVDGNYLKDLNVIGRDLSRSVLVDNSPHAFGYQVDNGIPIESWFEDPNDTELLKLEQFLESLHSVDDVRTVVRSTFQTYKLIRDARDVIL